MQRNDYAFYGKATVEAVWSISQHLDYIPKDVPCPGCLTLKALKAYADGLPSSEGGKLLSEWKFIFDKSPNRQSAELKMFTKTTTLVVFVKYITYADQNPLALIRLSGQAKDRKEMPITVGLSYCGTIDPQYRGFRPQNVNLVDADTANYRIRQILLMMKHILDGLGRNQKGKTIIQLMREAHPEENREGYLAFVGLRGQKLPVYCIALPEEASS